MAGTVALVLGSGGARGMAHIGVIQEIEARGYEVISVSGCSIGAVVGAFYSANKLDAFHEWALSLNYLNVLRLVDFSFISNGAIRGDKLFAVLSEMLGDIKIEDLAIPYTAVATDLISSKEVWFQRGSLEQAMRASAAIPGLIQPVEYENRLYVDGGVLNPLPIAASVSAHADYIIAVDLSADVPVPVITNAKQKKEDADKEEQAEKLKTAKAEKFEKAKQKKQDKQKNQDERSEKSLLASKLQFITPDLSKKHVWLNNVVDKASGWFGSDDLSDEGTSSVDRAKEEINGSKMGKLGILYQMFEVMQTSLSQYKIAGYPPDLLVKIPKNCVEMYEFYRAEELVTLGRHIAKEALDAFEQGHSSLYGQRLG
jgi:NTE family protein